MVREKHRTPASATPWATGTGRRRLLAHTAVDGVHWGARMASAAAEEHSLPDTIRRIPEGCQVEVRSTHRLALREAIPALSRPDLATGVIRFSTALHTSPAIEDIAYMPPSLIAPLILSLSLDTFAVSTAVGMAPLPRPARLRFAAACTVAEAIMPLIGLILGALVGRVAAVADWLAVVLLLGAGLWTLREALEDEDETAEAAERAGQGGLALLAAALSVSMDELAVGLALGALRLPVAPVVAAIAVQALLASLLGLWLGKQLGARAGSRAALLSGAVLCAVALWLAALQILGRG